MKPISTRIKPFCLPTALLLLVLTPLVSSGADAEVRLRNIVRKKLPDNVSAVALEYTVLLLQDGKEQPVNPNDYKFVVGDRFLVRIQPKDDMYTYIFTEGPTGQRSCLLPTSEEQPPFVKAGKVIELPNGEFFEFTPPPGEEKLIVVALAEPSKDLAALSNVVFHKPDELLTEGEKEQKAKLMKQYEQKMQTSTKAKNDAAKTRGVLKNETLSKFNQELAQTKHGTIEEPPHGDETSSFAMAVSLAGAGKPELLININLKSAASPKP
jgi:hypothetical protein